MTRHALVLVAIDARARATVSRALPSGLSVTGVSASDFVRMLARREVWAAIVDASAYTAELRTALLALKSGGTPLPVILLSPVQVSESRGGLVRGPNEVAYHDAEFVLWPKVRARGSCVLLREAGDLIQCRTRPGTRLRNALDAALSATQPFSSIRDLALHVGCDPSGLQKAWKKAGGGAPRLSLGMLIDSILLLRLMGDDTPEGQLTARRRQWGVGRDRARRITQRAIRLSFAEAKGSAHGILVSWFEANVLGTLAAMQLTSVRWRDVETTNHA